MGCVDFHPGVPRLTSFIYLACVMRDALEKAASEGSVKAASVPPGVLYEAQQFFDPAMEVVQEEIPLNPAAAVDRYLLCARILERLGVPGDREGIISRFDSLLKNWSTAQALDEEGVRDAKNLCQFFGELYRRGEERRYEEAMGHGH